MVLQTSNITNLQIKPILKARQNLGSAAPLNQAILPPELQRSESSSGLTNPKIMIPPNSTTN